MLMQKRVITIIISLFLLIAAGPNMVKALEPIGIMPLWLNVNEAAAGLTISSGTATCTVRVTGLSGTTKISSVISLQRRAINSTTFINIKTWFGSSNNILYTFSDIHTVSSGYVFRVRLDATVTRNGVNETVTVYSMLRTY